MLTTIIENYLQKIDQATFQKMMNHLLYLEGYKFIGSPGSVIGKNKTSKGSPDSFFESSTRDGYIFCECTTKKRSGKGTEFFKKLKSDIDHCFEVNKTGLDKNKISEVLLAFTEEIKPDEHKELKEDVKKHNPNAKLIIYSIQNIPFRLVYYPGLADKYIPGIITTKGTLYTLPDFLETTQRSIQPSLTNPFFGRETEIQRSKELLSLNDVLIITGNQGVGKSKLAAQLAEMFEKEQGFKPLVIASSPVPLWDDLNNFLLPKEKYIVFFDDANKALPNLDYLLQFIQQRKKGSTKVIVTVRDYVKHELNQYLLNLPHNEITIRPLENPQIKEIIENILPTNIRLNQSFWERIYLLAKGNARLAIMAVQTFMDNEDASLPKDTFALYDYYFSKAIVDEVSFLNSPQLLKSLGVLAFFGVLDKGDIDKKELLKQHFNIDWEALWESFIELDKLELVDVFSQEVVKISDQILATYTFYKTFFNNESALFAYSVWLEVFIERYPERSRNSFIDLINTYGFLEMKDVTVSLVQDYYQKIVQDNNKLFQFFDLFWFYHETETLIFIKKWVDNLKEEQIDISEIDYSYDTNDHLNPRGHLKLLTYFWHHDGTYLNSAIQLGLNILFTQPSAASQMTKLLADNLAFRRFDYEIKYIRQHTLIDLLFSQSLSDREKIITGQVFLTLVPQFLKWEYHQQGGFSDGKVTFYNFQLVETTQLLELREKILKHLFDLFNENEERVIKILTGYCFRSPTFNSSIYDAEKHLVTNFISKNLKPENYNHCRFVNKYIQTLRTRGISLSYDFNVFLESDILKLARILDFQSYDHQLEFDERRVKMKNAMSDFIRNRQLSFFDKFLKSLGTISSHDNTILGLHYAEEYLFTELASTNINLYLDVLGLVMKKEYEFKFVQNITVAYPIVHNLIPVKEFYTFLNRSDYSQKQHWNEVFFKSIRKEDIDDFFLREFLNFLFSVSETGNFYNLDFCLKYNDQFLASQASLPLPFLNHQHIITCVVEIVLSRISEFKYFLLDMHICSKYLDLFSEKLEMLKQVFFWCKKKDSSLYDLNGKELAAISQLDHFFLIEFLEKTVEDQSFIDFNFENLDLTYVINLLNYDTILDLALGLIISKAPIFSNFEHQANVLFKKMHLDEDQKNRVYDFISTFIERNYTSKQHVSIMINVVVYSFPDQLLRFLKEVLILNKDVNFIKELWLEKNEVTVNSRVPSIEKSIELRKQFIALVQNLPNSLDYFDHIKYWEDEIQWLEKDKQQAMKQDFRGWWT